MTEPLLSAVDLHTHILPGMDDGSRDTATSGQMLEALQAQGVQRVCLTSHYYAWDESIAHFAARREAALRHLRHRIHTPLTLIPGAETAFFPEIDRCAELSTLCLEGTRTLLLEMPFSDWTQHQVEQVISLKVDQGLNVVLVHPERFLFSKDNRRQLEKLADLHFPLQVNAGTLCAWTTRSDGLELLEMTDFPLLGTDCHNMSSRRPRMDKARAIVEKKLGRDFLQLIDAAADELLDPNA